MHGHVLCIDLIDETQFPLAFAPTLNAEIILHGKVAKQSNA